MSALQVLLSQGKVVAPVLFALALVAVCLWLAYRDSPRRVEVGQCMDWCGEKYPDMMTGYHMCMRDCACPVPGDRCSCPDSGVTYRKDGAKSMYCGQHWRGELNG